MPNDNRKSVSFYMEKELQKYLTPQSKNFLLCTWYRYMFPYIPYKTGLMASLMALSENKPAQNISPDDAMYIGLQNIQNDSDNVIRFRAPYASRQYEGTNFNFTRDHHPLAQAHWGDVAAYLHGEQITKEYKEYVKRSENE